MKHYVQCEFCNEVELEGKAIDSGWIPSFYKGDVEFGPACPICAIHHLTLVNSGEWVVA